MTILQPIAGSALYIGRRVANGGTVTAADFSGAVWTKINGLASLGDLGLTQNWVTQSFVDEGIDLSAKGTRSGNEMTNTFAYDPNDPGQIALRAAIASCSNYEFKLEAGAGCIPTSTVTITNAEPAVVTAAGGHGLTVGSPIVFSTTGTLPTGLTAGTTYYVISAGFSVTAFQVSATPGGSAVDTSGAGSGTHTVSGQPAGATALFIALAGEGTRSGGDANTASLQTYPLQINSNVVRI